MERKEMKCNLCSGKGKISIERFGRTTIHNCYVCEGVGKVEECPKCNGAGEKIIKTNGQFEFSACLTCVGHGVIPLVECPCNGKGYIWAQVGFEEPEYEPQPCGCHDKQER
tara:strand:+ start:456 stop:788 length:333 start_codon:yes stop_codon:yes gene_type:complete